MSNELPKKKRYVLSDGRIAYCYVNPNFIGLTKTAIEQTKIFRSCDFTSNLNY